MAFGVQASGFIVKAQTEVQDSLIARAKAAPALGPNLDYSSASPIGQLLGLMAGEIAELWELGQQVYSSNDPEGATGVPLDNILSLTGTVRPEEKASRSLQQTVTIEDGVTLTAGLLVSPVDRPDIFFELDANVENTSGDTATLPCTLTCTVPGEINVAAGLLTAIATPVAGWISTTNTVDVTPGRDAGSNQEARALRAVELFARGGSTVGAIRAKAQRVEGVLTNTVLENATSAAAEGLPPHSFSVVYDDGETPVVDADEMAQAVYDTRPAGIASQGSHTGTATDPEDGSLHVERRRRVTRKAVFIEVSLVTSASFPFDGVQKIKEAIATRGDGYQVGETVVREYLRAACFTIPGVVDVPDIFISFFDPPDGETNLDIGPFERAAFDTSWIEVNT